MTIHNFSRSGISTAKRFDAIRLRKTWLQFPDYNQIARSLNLVPNLFPCSILRLFSLSRTISLTTPKQSLLRTWFTLQPSCHPFYPELIAVSNFDVFSAPSRSLLLAFFSAPSLSSKPDQYRRKILETHDKGTRRASFNRHLPGGGTFSTRQTHCCASRMFFSLFPPVRLPSLYSFPPEPLCSI